MPRANIWYVLATRAGLFRIAVVLTSLYSGVTVLLARVLPGERMRGVQRIGLALAARTPGTGNVSEGSVVGLVRPPLGALHGLATAGRASTNL